jgi:hypothetical protein
MELQYLKCVHSLIRNYLNWCHSSSTVYYTVGDGMLWMSLDNSACPQSVRSPCSHSVWCCHSKETVMLMSCGTFLTSEHKMTCIKYCTKFENQNRNLQNYWSTFWEGAITLMQVFEWFHHFIDGHTSYSEPLRHLCDAVWYKQLRKWHSGGWKIYCDNVLAYPAQIVQHFLIRTVHANDLTPIPPRHDPMWHSPLSPN